MLGCRSLRTHTEYVVIESAIDWTGAVVRTRTVGVFTTAEAARNEVNLLTQRHADDEHYYVYSVEMRPVLP